MYAHLQKRGTVWVAKKTGGTHIEEDKKDTPEKTQKKKKDANIETD